MLAADAEPEVVPSQSVVLAFSGHSSRRVRVDGRDMWTSRGSTGLLAIDLTRSTGYHRVEVDESVFWFATEDAKLRVSGVSEMLKQLGSMGTGWNGQVLFSDGTGFRNPHVVYGWLDQWCERALDAIDAVLLAPRQQASSINRLSRRGGSAIRTVPTLRHLRSAPRERLTQRDEGLLAIGLGRYDPLRVVVRKGSRTVHTVPNRRAVQLLDLIASCIREVLNAPAEQATRTRCRLWALRAGSMQSRALVKTLRPGPSVLHLGRQAEELTDRRYGTVFELARDLGAAFGWSPLASRADRYSYVQRADSIYQAYAVSRMAASLGLSQTTTVLGERPLAFSGPDFDLYYDSTCDPLVLRSWRALSEIPDESRPDALLHERATGRVAVLDAKYRIAGDGWATESSRKEVASYMGLYGLAAVGILFPGSQASTRQVQGSGQQILEVPVSPATDAIDRAGSAIRALLRAAPY